MQRLEDSQVGRCRIDAGLAHVSVEWGPLRVRVDAAGREAHASYSSGGMHVLLDLAGPASTAWIYRNRYKVAVDPTWDLMAPFVRSSDDDDDGLHPFDLMTARVLQPYHPSPRDLEAVRRAINGACSAALSAVPHGTLSVARTFEPRKRMQVLRALLGDATGRLTQLGKICPALVTIALSRVQEQPDWIERILAGEKLPAMLDDVGAARWPDLQPVSARTWLRCAPASVDHDDLAHPPMWRVIRSDVPLCPVSRSAWYEVMCEVGRVVRASARVTDHAQQDFGDYVSKHAVALAPRMREAPHFLHSAYTHVRLSDKRLCRSRSLTGWLRDVAPFMALGEEDIRRVRELMGHVRPPFAGPRGKKLHGKPLTSVAALAKEGAFMQHCVGDFGAKLLVGDSSFYSMCFEGEHMTLELERVGEFLQLASLKGPRNAEPSAPARHAVARWLGRRGVVTGV